MKQILQVCIWMMLLISTALTGCDEYTSRVPLSEKPTAPIPDSLLGDWLYVDTAEIFIRPAARLSVYHWDEQEYLGLHASYSDKHPGMTDVTPMRLFRTDIGETPYLNLMYLANADRVYAFYAYRPAGSEIIRYSYVTETFTDTFATSEQLHDFVSRNPEAFAAALDSTWRSFYRDRYWTWEKANAKWLGDITQAWICEPSGQPDSFLVWPAHQVLAEWHCKPMSAFDLRFTCRPYHLTTYNGPITGISGGLGSDPIGFYILTLGDGTAIKYLHYPGSLTDLTHGILYVRTDP